VVPECAAHGGSPWLELTSQHFVVTTNLAPAEARAAAVQLEHARASILAAFPTGEAPVLDAVIFESAAQLHELSGDPLLDAALAHDRRGPLLLTGNAGSLFGVTQLRAMLHELAHHFSAGVLRRWPRWFEEGFAIYLETITLDPDAKTVVRGAAHQERLDQVTRWGVLPVKSLWAWDVEPDRHNGLEEHRAASSWFWVHFFVNEHRPMLDRFMRSLAEGEEPGAAWTAAFGTLTPEVMAAEATAYLARQQTRSQKMDVSQLNTSLSERTVPDAEVHAVLSRAAAATGAWPRARAEARAAMALNPHDLKALEQDVVTQESPEARAAAARALTEAAPGLAAGWLLLGLSLPANDALRGQALEKALELDPQSVTAAIELAAFRCAEGRCPEGVALAERAVSLAPGDARVHASAASVFLQAGQCAKAQVSQQRALETLPHRASAALRSQLQARLAEYQRCSAPQR
jgi:tetratricopeptide (TPR) repeat protein